MKAFLDDIKVKEKYAKHKKAEASVETAKQFLIRRGFRVSDPQHAATNGPDLVAIKGGFGCKVEVKVVSLSSRALKVTKVTRPTDDFVLLVFPSGCVHVETMRSHLAQCAKDGSRCVTALGKIL